jgi:dienelactone hydrolase
MRTPCITPWVTSVIVLLAFARYAAAEAPASSPLKVPDAWLKPPATHDAPGYESEKGVNALFLDGPAFAGKPTRVFAWVGLPEKIEAGKKVPGIVLVHGGGGTAFAAWVRLWTSRGYAAVAMDTCGQIPRGSYGKWQRNPNGGPPGWGGFDQVDKPREDQWTYHAVADVILAHSLLRSMPEVDADRVGITGISWGGYLTCIVAGLDGRLKFAAPVYGCGFLGENSTWKSKLDEMGEKGQRWLSMWDPKHYLPDAKMPMLWVTGTNDFAYPMDSLKKSYRLPTGERTLCVTLRMPHGHGGAGENPKEIRAFADSIVSGGPRLARIERLEIQGGNEFAAVFDSEKPIGEAMLNYTTAGDGPWKEREWKSAPAELDVAGKRASAKIPPGARFFYLNLVDGDGLIVSTEHVERPSY